MDNDKDAESLYQYASEYKFDEFSELLLKMAARYPAAKLLDAYLMQVQIKLFAADQTCMHDLETADAIQGTPRFPCLNERWQPAGANRFVVFGKTPKVLQQFLQLLPQAGEKLSRWYGETGLGMARQMQSEILYFLGDFNGALTLSQERYRTVKKNSSDALLSQYVLFRCYLAAEAPEEAKQCMVEVERIAAAYPECRDAYNVIRGWANLTTGWSGDTPRFHFIPNGEVMPVLEDRLAAIRKGISRLSPAEEPFAAFAERSYTETYTMRQHYMDIFHAMNRFRAGEYRQMEFHFLQTYEVSNASGLIMPIVEYGKQIVPLLQYVKENGLSCPHDWIDRIISLAERYERSLKLYRI